MAKNEVAFVQSVLEHKQIVGKALRKIIDALISRAIEHDNSKLEGEELEGFSKVLPKLRSTTYGTQEYNDLLEENKEFIELHYAKNSHHPEHHKNGIKDMSLVDLVELLCDWVAATEKHADGNINKSLEINRERFKMSKELETIFENTIKVYFKK